jgi:dTMP kinase
MQNCVGNAATAWYSFAVKIGQLFVFEGADEVGKTTLATMLVKELSSVGRDSECVAFPGNQAGTLGHHINKFHHNSTRFGVKHVNPTSLQLLHVAAHIDSIEHTIVPALRRNRTVVLDRFWWSTWVYGCISQGNRVALKLALEAEAIHWGRIRPTRVFLITRAFPLKPQKDLGTWKRINAVYRRFATQQKQNYPVSVIRNDSTVEDAFEQIMNLV